MVTYRLQQIRIEDEIKTDSIYIAPVQKQKNTHLFLIFLHKIIHVLLGHRSWLILPGIYSTKQLTNKTSVTALNYYSRLYSPLILSSCLPSHCPCTELARTVNSHPQSPFLLSENTPSHLHLASRTHFRSHVYTLQITRLSRSNRSVPSILPPTRGYPVCSHSFPKHTGATPPQHNTDRSLKVIHPYLKNKHYSIGTASRPIDMRVVACVAFSIYIYSSLTSANNETHSASNSDSVEIKMLQVYTLVVS